MMSLKFLRYGLLLCASACALQAQEPESFIESEDRVDSSAEAEDAVGRPFTGLLHDYIVAPVALVATIGAAGATVALPVCAVVAAADSRSPVSAGPLLIGSAVCGALTYLGVKVTIASYKKMWNSYFPENMNCKPEDKKLNSLGYAIASGVHALQATASFSAALIFAPSLALCAYDSLMAYWLFENFKKHHDLDEKRDMQELAVR